MPIYSFDGYALGTICVIDKKPRTITRAQRSALEALARIAMRLIEDRVERLERPNL
jgi:GAF domain-containing protein